MQRRAQKHENAWRHRILQRLGSGVDEQKMKDLLRLATFRMLSREPRRRSLTRMLACRSLSSKRTPSLRCAVHRAFPWHCSREAHRQAHMDQLPRPCEPACDSEALSHSFIHESKMFAGL